MCLEPNNNIDPGLPCTDQRVEAALKERWAVMLKLGGLDADLRRLAQEEAANDPALQQVRAVARFRDEFSRFRHAIHAATECGAFDALAGDVHPDTINHVCDAVTALAAELPEVS